MVGGHYEIGLPWKNYPPRLSDNRAQAEQRLRSLKKRLQQNPPLLEKYKLFMNDLLDKDYARKVTSPSDCDALRFLWWPEGNLSEEPVDYEMRVHLFGGSSSPSCANFALKKTAKDNQTDFSPKVIETVERNCYVDDCHKSVGREDETVDLTRQLRSYLPEGGSNLRSGFQTRER